LLVRGVVTVVLVLVPVVVAELVAAVMEEVEGRE